MPFGLALIDLRFLTNQSQQIQEKGIWDMEWKILCLRLKDGLVSPLAKTKRDVSDKEMRRLCRKFRKDEDVIGEVLMPDWRLGLDQTEMRRLKTI